MDIQFGSPYTTNDGEFTFNINDLPAVVIERAVRRAFNHVFHNEAEAKVAAAKKKTNGGDVDDVGILANARRDLHEKMVNGLWGESGVRGPRTISGDRAEAIYQSLLVKAVRQAMAKAGAELVEGQKDVWQLSDGTMDLDTACHRYLNPKNPLLGQTRAKDLREAANTQFESEKAERARKEEARKRDAQATKGGTSVDDFEI